MQSGVSVLAVLSLLTKAQSLTLIAFGLIRSLLTSRSMNNTTQKLPAPGLFPSARPRKWQGGHTHTHTHTDTRIYTYAHIYIHTHTKRGAARGHVSTATGRRCRLATVLLLGAGTSPPAAGQRSGRGLVLGGHHRRWPLLREGELGWAAAIATPPGATTGRAGPSAGGGGGSCPGPGWGQRRDTAKPQCRGSR